VDMRPSMERAQQVPGQPAAGPCWATCCIGSPGEQLSWETGHCPASPPHSRLAPTLGASTLPVPTHLHRANVGEDLAGSQQEVGDDLPPDAHGGNVLGVCSPKGRRPAARAQPVNLNWGCLGRSGAVTMQAGHCHQHPATGLHRCCDKMRQPCRMTPVNCCRTHPCSTCSCRRRHLPRGCRPRPHSRGGGRRCRPGGCRPCC